jgi:bifunctional non-homologous end joining protein LigD
VRQAAEPEGAKQMADKQVADRSAIPGWLAPQLATLVEEAPAGDDWIHEIKYDGFRILSWLEPGRTRLLTRNRKDWTARFPVVARELAGLGLVGTVLDGEIVVELADGRTSFQALQNHLGKAGGGTLRYYVFDVLYLRGKDVRGQPQLERKAGLEGILRESGTTVRLSGHVRGRGPEFLEGACRHHLEGIISKRATAAYRGGRSGSWLKVKCLREQEFVIGGFTEPGGSRKGLGALHVGTYDAGRLVYRGKVGTGFSADVLRDLRKRLDPLRRADPPFESCPRGAAVRTTRWVEPELVAQIRYTEITSDGVLRHPSYAGLREDKEAKEVVLDEAAAGAAGAKAAAGAAPHRPGSARGQGAASGRGVGSPIRVGGTRLTSPDRVVYAEAGVTKRELAHYYESVAAWMLPHIAERPLTLVRCPAGQAADCFYQKHFNDSVPDGVRRIRIREKSGPEWYGVLSSVTGLVSLVQLGALELHTWNSRAHRLERPDRFIIDLDPGPGVAWEAVVDAALHVRYLLEELGLQSFVKTTGGKGLHVVVPLVRRAEWEEVRVFSREVASLLARTAPKLYTIEASKLKRRGRILLDYLRNARGATAIEAYSTRARPGATVAAPIHWDELGDGVRADSFTVANMPARMKELGTEPWSEMRSVRQSLTAAVRGRLGL